jgi:ABC-type uncharacterized transport system involved in gliding motility auxiliary subunit
VLFVVAVVAANAYVDRFSLAWDSTAERSATLSDETLTVLRHVHRRVEITAVFPRDAVGRVEAATLLSRYRKANHRITFRILDPSLQPGEAQRLGLGEVGSAAVQSGGKVEAAQYTIEIDLTSAIARLLRNVSGTVCFTTGHGERAPDDADASGLSQAADLLRSNGYTVRSVDLLAGPSVPPSCDAVVVAAPASPLGGPAVRALQSYLQADGKAFVLGDPKASADPTPVTAPWGIGFDRGTVIEADPGSHLPGDVTAPIVHTYSESSPPVRGLSPTFFPGVERVYSRNLDNPGLTTAEVAFTTQLSYLDRGNLSSFDEKVDARGPISIAATADYSSVSAPATKHARINRTRVIAVGDVDFATNAFVGEAANAKLLLQGVDWLTQPEELVTAVPNFPKVRELKLTAARSRYMLLLTAGAVPGLFVIAGAMIWVLRRGR